MQTSAVRLTNTCRLVPTRYPSEGILDAIASPDDLPAIFELESWTNDRISTELGILHMLPPEEVITGRPMASVIMAAFCHPKPQGSRFNGPGRGAWYASFDIETAHAEVVYHRTRELAEVGVFETRVEMRLYHADFNAEFHDIRALKREYEPYHDRESYVESQALARRLMEEGSNGVLYRSVRHAGGECVACFRPRLVQKVRAAGYFEYRWEGTAAPRVRKL